MKEAVIAIKEGKTGQFAGIHGATKDHKVKMVVNTGNGTRAADYSGRVRPNPKNQQEIILELWWSGDNDYIIAMVFLNVQFDRYRVMSNVAVPLPDLSMVVEYNHVKGRN